MLQTEEKQEAPEADRAGDLPADWADRKKGRIPEEKWRAGLVWPEESKVLRADKAWALCCTTLANKPGFWCTYRLYQHRGPRHGRAVCARGGKHG